MHTLLSLSLSIHIHIYICIFVGERGCELSASGPLQREIRVHIYIYIYIYIYIFVICWFGTGLAGHGSNEIESHRTDVATTLCQHRPCTTMLCLSCSAKLSYIHTHTHTYIHTYIFTETVRTFFVNAFRHRHHPTFVYGFRRFLFRWFPSSQETIVYGFRRWFLWFPSWQEHICLWFPSPDFRWILPSQEDSTF